MKYLTLLLLFASSLAFAQTNENEKTNDSRSKEHFSFVNRQFSFLNDEQAQKNRVDSKFLENTMAVEKPSEVKLSISLSGGATSQYFNDKVDILDGFYQYQNLDIGNLPWKTISNSIFDNHGNLSESNFQIIFN